jgi:hypothetical protein
MSIAGGTKINYIQEYCAEKQKKQIWEDFKSDASLKRAEKILQRLLVIFNGACMQVLASDGLSIARCT